MNLAAYSSADRVERRVRLDVSYGVWSVGSCGLCQTMADADEQSITESNLVLRTAAQVAADMYWNSPFGTVRWTRADRTFCRAR
jgi:hypothetical protein